MRWSLKRSRALCAGLVMLVIALMLTPSSAATLGGQRSDAVGGSTATTRTMTGVTLDWNRDVPGLAVQTVRLTADDGERFTAGDRLAATVDAGASGRCDATRTADTTSRAVDLAFTGCELALTELEHIAVTITGHGQARVIEGNLGGLAGTLSAFDGDVVDPDPDIAASVESAPHDGTETIRALVLDVRGATVDQLIGHRVVAGLDGNDVTPAQTYAGTIGTADDNDGVWADPGPVADGGARSTVTIDIRQLVPEGDWPRTADVAGWAVAIVRPQRLDAVAPGTYAVQSVSGTVDHDEETTPPVTNGTQPVDLDPRLVYSEPNGPIIPNNQLYFCYSFQVTNTDPAPVDWEVTFDTTLAPLWGFNPTIIAENSAGALSSIWGGETTSYDAETGYWTIRGLSYNRTLAPAGQDGSSAHVGYCARAAVPEADPSTYDAPQISVDPWSNAYAAALAVHLTSSSPWFVPWETEVDLADYFCADTLPSTITGENATLTRIEGTRYLLRGAYDANTRFVSATNPRDFVFFRYNPGGRNYAAGSCAE